MRQQILHFSIFFVSYSIQVVKITIIINLHWEQTARDSASTLLYGFLKFMNCQIHCVAFPGADDMLFSCRLYIDPAWKCETLHNKYYYSVSVCVGAKDSANHFFSLQNVLKSSDFLNIKRCEMLSKGREQEHPPNRVCRYMFLYFTPDGLWRNSYLETLPCNWHRFFIKIHYIPDSSENARLCVTYSRAQDN